MIPHAMNGNHSCNNGCLWVTMVKFLKKGAGDYRIGINTVSLECMQFGKR